MRSTAEVSLIARSTVNSPNTVRGISVQFSTKPDGAVQSVLPQMNLAYSWIGPTLTGSDIVAVDMLIGELQQFFPVLPQGGIPSSWSTVSPSGNGIFNFAELAQDPTMPGPAQHFGILTDYGVNGNFTFDSVSGAFVTPEPGTLLPTAALLLVLGAAVFSKSRS